MLETETGERLEFDAVILATHSDTSLQMLGRHAPEVQGLLACQSTVPAVTHSPVVGAVLFLGQICHQQGQTSAVLNFNLRQQAQQSLRQCIPCIPKYSM